MGLDFLAALGWLRAPLVARIAEYGFPGNVRELRNLAQALAVHSSALPEARLPDDWEQRLTGPAVRRVSTVPPTGRGESSPRPPPSAPQPKDVSDDEFLRIARSCKYSKSLIAEELGWDRRLVDKRSKTLNMRSVKEISKSEFAAAVRKLGRDWDRLVDHFQVSRKALQDAFGSTTPSGSRGSE